MPTTLTVSRDEYDQLNRTYYSSKRTTERDTSEVPFTADNTAYSTPEKQLERVIINRTSNYKKTRK